MSKLTIKTIAIDCDDVIVATAPAILRYYNQTYGTNIALPDFYSTDPGVWGVKEYAEAIRRVEAYLKSEEYQNLAPFEDAIEILRKLRQKYELHIITARANFLAEATKRMLAQYFPDIFSTVEFTNHFGKAARTKAQVCQELGADVLIEDSLHHAQAVASCGIDVLLFGDYPWNQASNLPANITRVRDWKEVAERLL